MLKHSFQPSVNASPRSMSSSAGSFKDQEDKLTWMSESHYGSPKKRFGSIDIAEMRLKKSVPRDEEMSESVASCEEGFWWDRKGEEEAFRNTNYSWNLRTVGQGSGSSSSGSNLSDTSMMDEEEVRRTAHSVWMRNTNPCSDVSLATERLKTRTQKKIVEGDEPGMESVERKENLLEEVKVDLQKSDPPVVVPQPFETNLPTVNSSQPRTGLGSNELVGSGKIRNRVVIVTVFIFILIFFIILLNLTIQAGRTINLLNAVMTNLTETKYQLYAPNVKMINLQDSTTPSDECLN